MNDKKDDVVTCKSCKFNKRNPTDPLNLKAFMCVRFPPHVSIFPAGMSQQGLQLGNATSYPQIMDDTIACGEYSQLARLISS